MITNEMILNTLEQVVHISFGSDWLAEMLHLVSPQNNPTDYPTDNYLNSVKWAVSYMLKLWLHWLLNVLCSV